MSYTLIGICDCACRNARFIYQKEWEMEKKNRVFIVLTITAVIRNSKLNLQVKI